MKVAIVGTESTGKTNLCKKLALKYKGYWVPEYARYYLYMKGNTYSYDDLAVIAAGQMFWEKIFMNSAGAAPVFFDTTLLTIKIWSEWKYGKTDPLIEKNYCPETFDVVLLTDIDVPWDYDPQRENPFDRKELFEIHVRMLNLCNKKFGIISGLGEKRLLNAINYLESTKNTFSAEKKY